MFINWKHKEIPSKIVVTADFGPIIDFVYETRENVDKVLDDISILVELIEKYCNKLEKVEKDVISLKKEIEYLRRKQQ